MTPKNAKAKNDKVQTMEEAAHQGIDKTRAVLDENLSAAKDKVSRAALEVRRAEGYLKEKKARLADAARDKYDETRDGVTKAGGKVRELARDNPAATVAVAAGVGFCVGLALSQSRS